MKLLRPLLIILLSIFFINSCFGQGGLIEPSVAGACGNEKEFLPINQIQGVQHRSPYDGKDVYCVRGVVTAVDGGGFFLQGQEPDDDPRTSEAIYVDLLAFVNVKKGDLVVVEEGNIREYNPAGLGENSLTTTSLRASKVQVLKSNQTLPAPVVLGEGGRTIPDRIIENDVNGYVGRSNALFDPQEDGMDFFESLEAMLVQVNNAVAITSVNGFNEVVVLADGGKATSELNEAGFLLLAEDDPNPERLLIDDAFISMPQIKLGDTFTSPIVGIIGYDYGNYRIMPTDKLVFQANNRAASIVQSFDRVLTDNQISIASFNALNLSHLEDPERLKAIANMIHSKLSSPDILVIQEIMDDDGRLDSGLTSADENLKALSVAIKAAGGPEYLSFDIDPERRADGGVDGGNIRVAILFRLDRGLEFLSASIGSYDSEVGLRGTGFDLVLTQNPGLIWPHNSAFNQSRKPIIAQFRFKQQNFFVIGTHFNSKGPDGPLFGDEQPPILASERQRVAQAKAVNGFVKDILELDPNAKVIVAGDMNDFPWTESIKTLEGQQLHNLFATIDRNRWVTYLHEGNGQVLDQMVVTDGFLERLVEFQVLNVNSALPAREQTSDHDPIIAIFDFGIYE